MTQLIFLDIPFSECQHDQKSHGYEKVHFLFTPYSMLLKQEITIKTPIHPFNRSPLLVQPLEFVAITRYFIENTPIILPFDSENTGILVLRFESVTKGISRTIIAFVNQRHFLSSFIDIENFPVISIGQIGITVLFSRSLFFHWFLISIIGIMSLDSISSSRGPPSYPLSARR